MNEQKNQNLNQVTDNIKDNTSILVTVSEQIATQQNLLKQSVDGISNFVAMWPTLDTVLKPFKNVKDINIVDKLEKIHTSLDQANKIINNYNSNLTEKYKNLDDAQEKIANFVTAIDVFLKNINNLNLQNVFAKLEQGQNMIENLNQLVQGDFAQQIVVTNNTVTEIENAILDFIKNAEEQQKRYSKINELVEQTQTTNNLLEDLSKTKNYNEAILFDLMDKWFEQKKGRKK